MLQGMNRKTKSYLNLMYQNQINDKQTLFPTFITQFLLAREYSHNTGHSPGNIAQHLITTFILTTI